MYHRQHLQTCPVSVVAGTRRVRTRRRTARRRRANRPRCAAPPTCCSSANCCSATSATCSSTRCPAKSSQVRTPRTPAPHAHIPTHTHTHKPPTLSLLASTHEPLTVLPDTMGEFQHSLSFQACCALLPDLWPRHSIFCWGSMICDQIHRSGNRGWRKCLQQNLRSQVD